MTEETLEIASVAGWLRQRGWAERNAGNISVRLDAAKSQDKHSIFATCRTPQQTLDMINLLAKSASIRFLCRSAGYDPEGLTGSQLTELSKIKF